ncbi:hypothetical protein ACHWQZ_G000928 [Mnemiopsis leidyi]
MSSSTPLLTHPPREDPRSMVNPGKEQSALSWNPPKRGGGKRAGEGGKQLPKPGVRNSRCSDTVVPLRPSQDASASPTLGTSALGTSTILDFSSVTVEVDKRPPKLTRSSVVDESVSLEKDKPAAAVRRSATQFFRESQKDFISPPEDIPPTTLHLVKSSAPVAVHTPDIPVTPIQSVDIIPSKPRKASVVVDISKTRRSSIVSRKTSTIDLPKQKNTSATDGQRSRRISHHSESSRHSSNTDHHGNTDRHGNTDHHGKIAGITPETLRAAEVWKSRTNALKLRGAGGGVGRHVSFDEMVMDRLAEQKGISEHKRRHNQHPLARFRSLAITTNNRARNMALPELPIVELLS